jgi:hypothetical protein
VLLPALDRCALPVPDLGDVEEGVGLPAHLLGLVRLEQVQLRRAQHLLARIVTPGLCDHPALQRHLRRIHVVGVVRVVLGMAEHERRLDVPDDVDQAGLVISV